VPFPAPGTKVAACASEVERQPSGSMLDPPRLVGGPLAGGLTCIPGRETAANAEVYRADQSDRIGPLIKCAILSKLKMW
jgi:hypothetical protein